MRLLRAQSHPGGLHPIPRLSCASDWCSAKLAVALHQGPQTCLAGFHGSLHPVSVPPGGAGQVGRSPPGHPQPVGAGVPALQDQSGARFRAQVVALPQGDGDGVGSSAALLVSLEQTSFLLPVTAQISTVTSF